SFPAELLEQAVIRNSHNRIRREVGVARSNPLRVLRRDTLAADSIDADAERLRDVVLSGVFRFIWHIDTRHARRCRWLLVVMYDHLADIGSRGIEDFSWKLTLEFAPGATTIDRHDQALQPRSVISAFGIL